MSDLEHFVKSLENLSPEEWIKAVSERSIADELMNPDFGAAIMPKNIFDDIEEDEVFIIDIIWY